MEKQGVSLDNSSNTTTQAVQTNDCLCYIFEYLEENDFKNARLVCKSWNETALSIFWKTLSLKFWKFSMQYQPEDNGAQITPMLFSSLCLREQEDNPNSRDLSYCLSFLTPSNTFQYATIHHINIAGGGLLESFTKLANSGAFPQLLELTVNERTDSLPPTFTLLPGSLSSLKKLKIYRFLPEEAFDPPDFYQSLINSAPNLEELETGKTLNLAVLRKLRKLHLRGLKVHLILHSVKDTLTYLKLEEVEIAAELPILPKLKELVISGLWESKALADAREALQIADIDEPDFDFSKHFPKLEILRCLKMMNCSPHDNLVLSYLNGPYQLLRIFEMKCCDITYHGDHRYFESAVITLTSSCPSLHLLKIQTSCAFTTEHSRWQLMNGILNLRFQHLIVSITSANSLSSLFKDVRKADINCEAPTFGRKRIIEIHDSSVWTQLQNVENGIRDFPSAVLNLAKKWDLIRFRHCLVEDNFRTMMEDSMAKYNLPVELFSGPKIGQSFIFARL